MPNISYHSRMPEISEQGEIGNITWLKKISRLEKVVYFFIVSFLLMIIVMMATLTVFAYLYKYTTDSNQTNPTLQNVDNFVSSESSISNLCLTPGCVKAAATLLSSLDQNIDPCSDFYRFSCGEWLRTKEIAEDRPSAEVYYEAIDRAQLQFKTLLESNLDGTEPLFVTKVKEFYETCMDLESIEKAGSEPLENILTILGGWPVVEGRKWVKRKFDWIETLITLRKLGCKHNILLDLSVVVDSKNNSRHIIKLSQAPFGMPVSYLKNGLNDSATSAYYKLMVKTAKLLGASDTLAEREMLEALQFEMTLANYSVPSERTRNVSKTYNKYTIKEFQETINQVPWIKYINGLLINNEVDKNETLICSTPESIRKITDLIRKTDKRLIANYILWRVIANSLQSLSKDWSDINLEYDKILNGRKQEEPRWKICLEQVTKDMLIALSSYYVRHYFSDETKKQASEIVRYVRKEFLRILDETDWMDEETKTHATAKANSMIFYIGYPEELLNDTVVMEHYQNLTISNDSYFMNILRLHKRNTDSEFSMLRKPNMRENWKKHARAALVNAFYSRIDNSVEIPAAYLQSIFSKDLPNYINFATLGLTIGHEITHGFDDEGRQYDKDGNNLNWWTKTTDKHFKKKAQCIIDQYSNYTAENGMKVNGVNTQGENIADNGAFKESYSAYQAWVKDNGPEQLLPGLNYNQNQLYWINAAYISCTKYRPEYLKRFLLSFVHSPDEFRIIGPLSNLAEFARDFNCSADSPMNKKHKCHVW